MIPNTNAIKICYLLIITINKYVFNNNYKKMYSLF